MRESQLEIDKLKHCVDWLCRKLFGKSSEKVDPSQLALAFEQLAVEDAAAGAADEGSRRGRPGGDGLRASRGAGARRRGTAAALFQPISRAAASSSRSRPRSAPARAARGR
ncbi:MAG: transposase [Holophagales bacterium]|nr:transposase [Holophagales bacterium]